MLHALVLAAQAFPIRHWAEDAGAEQAIPLRLEGAVIDSFRLGYFPMGPTADLFRRRQTNANGIEIGNQIGSIVRRGTQNNLQNSLKIPKQPSPPRHRGEFSAPLR